MPHLRFLFGSWCNCQIVEFWCILVDLLDVFDCSWIVVDYDKVLVLRQTILTEFHVALSICRVDLVGHLQMILVTRWQ